MPVKSDQKKRYIIRTVHSPGQISRRVGGFKMYHKFRGTLVKGFAAELTKEQADKLKKTPGVTLHEDIIVTTQDGFANDAYGVTKVRQDFGLDGDGVTIAVLDTGVFGDHVDFQNGKIRYFRDFTNAQYSVIYDKDKDTILSGGTLEGLDVISDEGHVALHDQGSNSGRTITADFKTEYRTLFEGGDGNWFRDSSDAHSGYWSLKCIPEDITNAFSSFLDVDLIADGTLTLWFRTQSMHYEYEGFFVGLDGDDHFMERFFSDDWTQLQLTIPAGKHTLHLGYETSDGKTAACWVDDISLTNVRDVNYVTQGTRVTDWTSIDGKVEYIVAIWDAILPPGTSCKVEISVDNGDTWYLCENGYSIPEFDNSIIDLGFFIARYTLTTNDPKVTPVMTFFEAYGVQIIEDPYDDNGHGSHVCGIIASPGIGDPNYKGVAPKAQLVVLKVLDADGRGDTSQIIAAQEWIVENKDLYGIKVANMSLGASGDFGDDNIISIAANKMVDNGVLLIVANGNEGPGWHTTGAPASASKVLSIGALRDPIRGGYAIADFSSRGPTLDGRIKPDICAPGYEIMSCDSTQSDGYVPKSGTSMATPYVTGFAALIQQLKPDIDPTEIKQVLIDTAIKPWGYEGPDPDYGHGAINPFGAIQYLNGETNWSKTYFRNLPSVIRNFETGDVKTLSFTVDESIKSLMVTLQINETVLEVGWFLPTRMVSSPDSRIKITIVDPDGTKHEVLNPALAYPGGGTYHTRFIQFGYNPAQIGEHKLILEQISGRAEFTVDIGLAQIGVEQFWALTDISQGEFIDTEYLPPDANITPPIINIPGGYIIINISGDYIRLVEGKSSGTYISPPIPLQAGKIANSFLYLTGSALIYPGGIEQMLDVQVSFDRVNWFSVPSSGTISILPPYKVLTGDEVIYFKATFYTSNVVNSPILTGIGAYIDYLIQ